VVPAAGVVWGEASMTQSGPALTLCRAEAIRDQARLILMAWGMPADAAATTAAALLDCDLRGVETHGISLLTLYAQWMRAKPFNFNAEPLLVREGPGHALLDAQGNLGYVASVRAVGLAAAKAREFGISGVAVCNSRHFGAAGYYARLGAREGMIVLVATSTQVVCVVPPGAAAPMLGTNPLAYGIPREKGEPIVFDMATSTVSGNKIRVHALKDEPLPEGWVVNGQGAPVTDPHEGADIVFRTGAGGITPLGANRDLGGYKGFGLGLLVNFLAGALTGASFATSARRSGEDAHDVGHFFLAINPAAYRNAAGFFADVDDIAETLRRTVPLDPESPITMPGDRGNLLHAERLDRGVPLPAMLLQQLESLSWSLGVPFLLAGEGTPD